MDELVALVSQKTGLSKEQATAAVKVVLDFIKKKLPAPVAAEVDAVLSGSGELGAVAKALDDGKIDGNDVANLLGGFLGGKK
jgi:nucleoid DNA-binding protein